VYEDGVLKPLQQIHLAEREQVVVTVQQAENSESILDYLRQESERHGPAPSLDDVRRRMSAIPGNLTDDFIRARD
jgi:predicted DNA-binding antitoxin AbrB/MazE fold protein